MIAAVNRDAGSLKRLVGHHVFEVAVMKCPSGLRADRYDSLRLDR